MTVTTSIPGQQGKRPKENPQPPQESTCRTYVASWDKEINSPPDGHVSSNTVYPASTADTIMDLGATPDSTLSIQRALPSSDSQVLENCHLFKESSPAPRSVLKSLPARSPAGGVLGPGRSQGQGFQHRPRGRDLIPIMTYLNLKENEINPGFYQEN